MPVIDQMYFKFGADELSEALSGDSETLSGKVKVVCALKFSVELVVAVESVSVELSALVLFSTLCPSASPEVMRNMISIGRITYLIFKYKPPCFPTLPR